MKLAVCSSGLGIVTRGIEVWAESLAAVLAARSVDVTLFRGAGAVLRPFERVLPGLPRGTRGNRLVTRLCSSLGGWRYGLGSAYQTEQTAFALPLIRALREGQYDLVHLQDPWLAWLLEKSGRRGRHGAEVILAHGTEEDPAFVDRFPHVQELSPCYRDRHAQDVPEGSSRHMIPNFVDTAEFTPQDKRQCRAALGLPQDRFLILSVGAVNQRKGMDRLVREVAAAASRDSMLILAGACEEEGRPILAEAQALLRTRFDYREHVPRADMPLLYGAADVFVLCALKEIFGIVFLEAMASGIPCIGHTYPVTEWVLGTGAEQATESECAGLCIDMTHEGAVSAALAQLTPDWLRDRGVQARRRAERMFSQDAVVLQMVRMYEEVLRAGHA